jgi:hypothetical protein
MRKKLLIGCFALPVALISLSSVSMELYEDNLRETLLRLIRSGFSSRSLCEFRGQPSRAVKDFSFFFDCIPGEIFGESTSRFEGPTAALFSVDDQKKKKRN